MRKKFFFDIAFYIAMTLLIYGLMKLFGASSELQNAIWAGLILASANGVTAQVLHKFDEKKEENNGEGS